jgi:hypothetical protein
MEHAASSRLLQPPAALHCIGPLRICLGPTLAILGFLLVILPKSPVTAKCLMFL